MESLGRVYRFFFGDERIVDAVRSKDDNVFYFDGEPIPLVRVLTTKKQKFDRTSYSFWDGYVLFKMVRDGKTKVGFVRVSSFDEGELQKKLAMRFTDCVVNAMYFDCCVPSSVHVPRRVVDVHEIVRMAHESEISRDWVWFTVSLKRNLLTLLESKEKTDDSDIVDFDSFATVEVGVDLEEKETELKD